MDPILIIGTERSGTNLLRLILNSHPHITIPHPPHIIKNFHPAEQIYGNLHKDRNFRALIHDVVRTIELHPYPWNIKIDREEIFCSVKGRDLIYIFFAIYDRYLQNTGKKRWGCKSTFMIHHVSPVLSHYPNAKFIYMVRDGRDVACSARKSIFNRFSIYHIAKLWGKEQCEGIKWLKKLSTDQIFLLKYEDLCKNPGSVLEDLCQFLSEPFEEEMLLYFRSGEAQKCSALSDAWKNTSRDIMQGNTGKFRSELRKNEISLFESITGKELTYLGYKVSSQSLPHNTQKATRMKLLYLLEEWLLFLIVQIKFFFTDKNNYLRYKKYWFLKYTRAVRKLFLFKEI